MTVSPRLHRPARRLLLTASSLLLLGALSGCEKTPAPSFKSLDITGAEYARQLALTDANGQPFQLSSLKGKVAVVFFGYTQCPDVCPTTLTNLAETQRLLGPDGDKLVGVFVTVDPKRDTTALMKSYVGAFHPNWVGLRGSADEIAAAAKEFKIFYREVPGKTESSYTVDHTAASFVFDTQGKVRLYVRHNTPPAELAADIKVLLTQG
ncbi:SCO family protein [Sphaerotilus sp.]|uniref:SCO family protein n=1 Tax=Sphaerotilus sp. TaxID=2093942 RepID=UPI002ACD85CB|nr:SCO family protein [Sphaerotilus sp.]MDZ7855002.1 SCO family protein [Sphaerotilus sp.]